jgi:hypothetical protein
MKKTKIIVGVILLAVLIPLAAITFCGLYPGVGYEVGSLSQDNTARFWNESNNGHQVMFQVRFVSTGEWGEIEQIWVPANTTRANARVFKAGSRINAIRLCG